MRHRWKASQVPVQWTPAVWNLYTCTQCGLLRQSVPLDESLTRYKKVFGIPLSGGGHRWIEGKTPPCPAGHVAEAYMLCRTPDGVEMRPDDPALARQEGWEYLAGGLGVLQAAEKGMTLSGWGGVAR